MLLVRRPTPVLVGLVSFTGGIAFGIVSPTFGAVLIAFAAVALLVFWAPGLRVPAVVFAVGAIHGGMARRSDAGRCAARLESGVVTVEVRLTEPAPPGRPARTALVGACRGTIMVRHWLPDTLWAGSSARIEGRWLPRPSRWGPADGLLAARTVRPTAGRFVPTPTERLRNWMVRTIAGLYGPRSGMIEALVLGSRGTIEPSLAQAFARTGLVHLLSISGFHVGLVWSWVIVVMGSIGRRRAAPAVAAAIVVAYVGFIGAPAPALRATALGILAAIEVRRQRHVAPGGLAAAVAILVLLVDPWAVSDLGAWLSVSALWGATAGSRWSERVLGPSPLWSVLTSSAGATLATAPLVALVFGSVSLIGVALNLIAIPLASFALPAVLMSLLVAPAWESASEALAAGGGLLLHLLEVVAERGGAAPGVAITFEAGLFPAAVAVVAIGAGVWLFGRHNRVHVVVERGVWLAAVSAVGWLAVAVVARPHSGGGLTLHFLDVGQGDAALVHTGGGQWILVDAGPNDHRGDAGRRVVVPFLIRHGVRRLAAVVVSHAHRDHFGGLPAVLEAATTDIVFEPGLPVADRDYLGLLDELDDRGIKWRPLGAGDRVVVDEVSIEVVHPDRSWRSWGEDLNENSVVIRLRAGGFEALLGGDAGFPAEDRLAEVIGRVDLLKVGHHGSRFATGQRWLARLRPAAAVISVGANRYGHPSPEAMARLDSADVAVWRTDRDGTITVRVGRGKMRITSRRGEAVLPLHE